MENENTSRRVWGFRPWQTALLFLGVVAFFAAMFIGLAKLEGTANLTIPQQRDAALQQREVLQQQINELDRKIVGYNKIIEGDALVRGL